MDKEEIKSQLRDWLTATTQLFKVHHPIYNARGIAFWWTSTFGIKMNEAWVKKALYGKKGKDHDEG